MGSWLTDGWRQRLIDSCDHSDTFDEQGIEYCSDCGLLLEPDISSCKPALTTMYTQDGPVEVTRVPLIDHYPLEEE